MISDAELISRYTATRSSEDFAALVDRHGAMVLRTCQRVTRNRADAEDALQSTFLVLAQRPEAVTRNLAGWLHKVARDSACRVVRTEVRRVHHQEASARMKGSAPVASDADLREEIDAALFQLPNALREAVILRYLEDRDSGEAAELAGCNENTLRWRAMKGLERLRTILGRRQVAALSVSALAAFLTQEALAQVPAVTMAAVKLTAIGGAVESTRAAVVAKGVLNGLFWSKVKAAGAAVAVAAGVVSVGAAVWPPQDAPPAVQGNVAANLVQLGLNGSLNGRRPFPDDNPWNQEISTAPVDPNSDRLIASLGADKPLKGDFGTFNEQEPMGIAYYVVGSGQPRSDVHFAMPAESDAGPYPLPPPELLRTAPRRDQYPIVMLDRDQWKLYELSTPRRAGERWQAEVGVVFDLSSNALRPAGWTSVDGSGMAIFPGLARYDEAVEQKAIRHALRFTASRTRRAYVAPARHFASTLTDPALPPMGMRVRLRASFDVHGYPLEVQVILQALKTYGMFLAEHGTDWYVSGTHDRRWNDANLRALQQIHGHDFEVVRMGPIQTE
jgi:RNA polymerase sigma factor (sigma-70 family)